MRVLVTGDRGRIGRPLTRALRTHGIAVSGFDRVRGDELLDASSVRAAAAGCDAIVHAAALPAHHAGSDDEIMAVNVSGTQHVLLAAEQLGIPRVVHFSSIQVFGLAKGELAPLYLPVDDDHPRRATRPYGVSKRLGEDLCAEAATNAGTVTVSLRPVAGWSPPSYRHMRRRELLRPVDQWSWRDGTFVDIRDVTTAVIAALTVPLEGHVPMLLSSADVAYPLPTAEMTARLLPDVPWRDGAGTDASHPFVAPFDTSVAWATLGWVPRYTWSRWTRGHGRVERVLWPTRRAAAGARRAARRLRTGTG